MKEFWLKIRSYVLSIAIALAVGGLSSLITSGKMAEYNELARPPLAPPEWVFPVAWTLLFILMGVSAAMIWRSGSAERGDALFLYGVQLVVNFLWTVFYFGFDARLLAFFWLVFLLLLVILMIVRFTRISPAAAKLQIPYAVWLVFAGYLNLGTYLLNR